MCHANLGPPVDSLVCDASVGGFSRDFPYLKVVEIQIDGVCVGVWRG